MMANEKTGGTINVHRISVAGISNVYIVENGNGLFLVDAGSPRFEQQILNKLAELGRDDVRLIFLTHAHIDHFGGAAIISEATNAPIAIHKADAEALSKGETRLGSIRRLPRRVTDFVLPRLEPTVQFRPTEADILCDDGDSLHEYGLDALVIHLPGHTPGSAGLLVENQIAFVGDLISTAGRPNIQRAYASNWEQIMESVKRLHSLNPTIVYPGHGSKPLTTEELEALVE